MYNLLNYNSKQHKQTTHNINAIFNTKTILIFILKKNTSTIASLKKLPFIRKD